MDEPMSNPTEVLANMTELRDAHIRCGNIEKANYVQNIIDQVNTIWAAQNAVAQ